MKSTTSGGTAPTINPDEIVIGRIEKRIVTGNIVLTSVKLNRGSRLISLKDISDEVFASLVTGYSTNIGDGASTSLTVTHNLGTRDVIAQVYRNGTPWDTIECGVERSTTNTITFKFVSAPASNEFRVLITSRIALTSVVGVSNSNVSGAGVTVGTSSTTVVATNYARREVVLTNDHASNIVYLALGSAAVLNQGIRLNPGGGTYITENFTGTINAIATGSGTTVTYSEI